MSDLSSMNLVITEDEKISGLPPEWEILYFGKTKEGLYIVHAQQGKECIFLGKKDKVRMTSFTKYRQTATTIYSTPDLQFVVFDGRPVLNLFRGHILTQLQPSRA